MAFMKLNTYRETCFVPSDIPDRRTVIGWIKAGQVVGKKLGKDWYVDPDAIIPVNDAARKILAAMTN